MFAAVEWANLTVAGAFILGAILATIATIRIVRVVATLFARGVELPERDGTRRRLDGTPSMPPDDLQHPQEPDEPPDDAA